MNKIKTYIKIIRPINFVITFLSIFIAGIICNENALELIKIVLASTAGAFVGSAGNIINDIFDIEIDKINRPERPLPSKKMNKSEALVFYYLLNLFAIILSVQINLISLLIVVFSEVCIFFYSYLLKKIPLLGNFTVSFFTGLAFVFGGAAVNNFANSFIPAVFAFLVNFIREIVKDIQDIEGDTKQNIITFPAKYGIPLSIKLINYLTIILILSTTIPIVYGVYKIEYYFAIIPVNVAFIYFIIKISYNYSQNNLLIMSRILKINMLLGLVAIYLGNKGFTF